MSLVTRDCSDHNRILLERLNPKRENRQTKLGFTGKKNNFCWNERGNSDSLTC